MEFPTDIVEVDLQRQELLYGASEVILRAVDNIRSEIVFVKWHRPTSDSTMKHCELAVTLVFESKGGTEIKNARKYKAYWFSRDNKWHISATP